MEMYAGTPSQANAMTTPIRSQNCKRVTGLDEDHGRLNGKDRALQHHRLGSLQVRRISTSDLSGFRVDRGAAI
jgi:hypothetical protein